ncbi:MAG: hypothetical protein ACRDOH_18610 [Streptosporangiaceae bacterium]
MFTIVASIKATAPPSAAIASTACGEGLPRIVSSPAAQQLRVGFECFARRPPSQFHNARKRFPVHQPDLFNARCDHQVAVPAGGGDSVDAVGGHRPHDRLAQARDLRLAAGQEAPDRAPEVPGRPPRPAVEASRPPGDVDRDDGTLAGARHRRHRQVVEHAAVNEQPPAGGNRRKHAGDRQA